MSTNGQLSNNKKVKHMTPIQEKIIGAVDKANGSASWEQIMDALEYPERQRALHEIRPLEKLGILNRVVSRHPETGKTLFVINRVEDEAAKIESAE